MNEAKHLIFVSDDGTAINSFVGKLSKELEGVNVEHVKCVVHLLRHIKDRMKKEDTLESYSDVRKNFYFARHSPTENVANTYLFKIKEKSEAAYKYIKDGHMSSFIYTYDTEHFLADTNNVSESLNSQMKLLEVNGKSVREASVFGCIYRFFIVAFNQMHYRKQDTFCLDPELKDYTKNYNYYCKFILKELSFLGYYYEVNQDHYEVNKTMNRAGMYVVKDHEWNCDFEVNFSERKCSCRMFQQNQYPCIHAIAVLHSRQEYYKVLSYVGDGYLNYNIYSNIFDLPEDYQTLITDVINNPLDLTDQEEASIAGIYIEIPEAIPLTNRIPSIGENVTFDDPPSINNNSNSEEKKETTQRKNEVSQVVPYRVQPSRQCKSTDNRQ